jgi:hypothetical protein
MRRRTGNAGTVRIAHNARKETMNNGQSYSSSGFKLNATPMVVGAALFGAGGLIVITGMIVGGTALFSATRQWFQELEVPPSEVVKHKWGQTKAATTAGASAWQQHHNGMHRAHA